MKHTDLWKFEGRPTPYTHRANSISSGEVVLQNIRTGQMEGSLYQLSKRNKLKGNHSLFEHTTNLVESSAECVGRVLSMYKDKDGVYHAFAGTGFSVTSSIVATAQHVIKPSHHDGALTLDKVYFTFTVNAQYDDEVKVGDEDVYEMELLPKYVDTLTEFQDNSDYAIGGEQWGTINDFAFLRFKDHRTDKYSLPARPSNDVTDCFVIAYPGYIGKQKFLEDYCGGNGYTSEAEENIGRLYATVKKGMDSFEKKIVSGGKSSYSSTKGYMNHQCPTIRGTSGGLLMMSPSSNCSTYFSAIHVGGNWDIQRNVAIPVSCTEFCVEYAKAIEDEKEFIKINKQSLREYFKPVKKEIQQYCPAVYHQVFE